MILWLPTLNQLPLCIKICMHVTIPSWDVTKLLLRSSPAKISHKDFMLHKSSSGNACFSGFPHVAFALCMSGGCAGLCAVLLRGHCHWSHGTVPTSAQMPAQMQGHAPASGVGTQDLVFSLALYRFVFPPRPTQRASEKQVIQGAAWSPLQNLVFFSEAVKRWPSKTITGLPCGALIIQGYEGDWEAWRENCLWLSPYYALDWIYWRESH